MARTNTRVTYPKLTTHEGAPAVRITPERELERSVLACLLWEKEFYEDGKQIADRILDLSAKVPADKVAALAIKARGPYNLRHAPLWLTNALATRSALKADTLAEVIQRADELTEFLSMYWKDGKHPLSAQVKKGLARAFVKFDAYQLSKYDRANAVRLRDVLFLVHPKPTSAEQGKVWDALVNGTLPAPDTWEVNLSAGANQKETWVRLLTERKLGYMALLRNLRNMKQAGVPSVVVDAELMRGAGRQRVLPFRFVAAARAVPQWEASIEAAMLASLANAPRLRGRTCLLVDVSGSMDATLSGRSDMTRMDAAAALAMLCREICQGIDVLTFSEYTKVVPARRGFALRDAIVGSQPHGSTMLGQAIADINANAEGIDRLIVFTDEQAHDLVPAPKVPHAYMINVASARNGVGYGPWTHIDGFSEAVVRYIQALEGEDVEVSDEIDPIHDELVVGGAD